jgi:phosphoribosylglycinamide formyltransferase-1
MIIVLTYEAPHRKTQDLLMQLAARGVMNEETTTGDPRVHVLAVPWEKRKNHKPMISHRPGEPHWPARPIQIPPDKFARNLGCSYDVTSKEYMPTLLTRLGEAVEVVLIGGAGILGSNIVNNHVVVNAHPAWIPYGRGLDSLKWCIYHSLPIGVTTHICDENADAGWILEQRIVERYEGDTFHALAHRQYEIEIGMLVNAVELVRTQGFGKEDGSRAKFNPEDSQFPVRRRMPAVKEWMMLRRFELGKNS